MQFSFSNSRPLQLIAGPCVIESLEQSILIAKYCKEVCANLGIEYVFKASFDKANRTSIDSFRGPGLEDGLNILANVRDSVGVRVLTDIHNTYEAEPTSKVVDIIQIPAFLCRQTDLILAAAKTGKIVNIKKGQFLSPMEIIEVVRKVESVGNKNILITERGTFFGYNNLVVDFKGFSKIKDTGYPLIFDATHSTQLPGKGGQSSLGESNLALDLAKAAVSIGIAAVFFEVHPKPKEARSDAATVYDLYNLESAMEIIIKIDRLVKCLKG